MNIIKVLFVCTGNICRSPLAHKLFEKLAEEQQHSIKFEVDSCGTYGWHNGQNADSRMRKTASKRGLHFDKYARAFRSDDIEEFDYLIAMDSSHMHYIKSLIRDKKHEEKVFMMRDFDDDTSDGMDVPDPYYGGAGAFEYVYDIIERSSKNFLTQLTDKHSSS